MTRVDPLSSRRRRGLSSSYSALDSVSMGSDELELAINPGAGDSEEDPNNNNSNGKPQLPQKAVSDCVKNLVQWFGNVGDKVGKGTTALLDALPSLSLIHI